MDVPQIVRELADAGLIDADTAQARELTGGVSSDIRLIDDGVRRLVVKQALPQLRVASEWRADVGRNDVERRYLDCVGRILPGSVPAVLHHSPACHFFAMEYLGGAFAPWKQRLMAGEADPAVAEAVGSTLGTIHDATWGRDDLRAAFDTTEWFDQLRLDPYLRTTAGKHPALRCAIEAEVERIAAARRCLVHGDYSPKNLLVAPDRVVIVDCEVAWFGDPTFDVAFLLNHLVLKALHLREHRDAMIDLARAAWGGYTAKLAPDRIPHIADHLPRLLPMLMLARVDGKSPLEYLTDTDHRVIRRFTARAISHPFTELDTLLTAWRKELDNA